MKGFARFAALFMIPAGLIVGAFVYYLNLGNMPASMPLVTKYAAYVLFAATAVISWWFNRSRVFFCVVTLAFTQVVMTLNLPAGMDSGFYLNEVRVFTAVFIPLNIVLFSFFKERGILTFWGMIRFAFLFVQSFFLLWWVGSEQRGVSHVLAANYIWKDAGLFRNLSQTALLIYLLALVVLIAKYVLYKSALDLSFAGALLLVAVAFELQENPMAMPVFFAFAGLALMIAVIQDSYYMAFMDELTGLPSRRALRHGLMKLSGRYTIAMLDVDFFKKFNDTYGHDVGDQVLRMVASVMREVSGGGKPFRYGGEEFTVLFPGKDLGEAIPHLEELREAISKKGFTQRSKDRPKKKPKKGNSKSKGGKQLFVTVSIGVAEKNEKHRQPEEVIKAADTALYRAKKKGRNCVSK